MRSKDDAAGATDRSRPATISDVARLADVSVGTVSNVLNNRSSVSRSRRERVLQAIDELGFSGSMLAKGMRGQNNSLVGFCVPNTGFANLAALIDTFDERSSNANFELIHVLSRYDSKRELARIRRLIAYRAAGLLIVPGLEPQAVLDHVYAAKLPTVIVNRLVVNERRFDQITIDHEKGIYEACQQLLAWGHTHIMICVQFPTLSVTMQRIEGIRRAIEETAGGARWSVLECGTDAARFPEIFAKGVRGRNPPSVVITSNSLVASWVLKTMRASGIKCPDDLSLLVLEEPDWAELLDPQISCVRQPTREIGRIAWDLLMNRVNRTAGDPMIIRFDGQLNFRASVARR